VLCTLGAEFSVGGGGTHRITTEDPDKKKSAEVQAAQKAFNKKAKEVDFACQCCFPADFVSSPRAPVSW
jgi:hypothetical protein